MKNCPPLERLFVGLDSQDLNALWNGKLLLATDGDTRLNIALWTDHGQGDRIRAQVDFNTGFISFVTADELEELQDNPQDFVSVFVTDSDRSPVGFIRLFGQSMAGKTGVLPVSVA